eukprot:493653-Pelagomonas_calceolata.AAC.8
MALTLLHTPGGFEKGLSSSQIRSWAANWSTEVSALKPWGSQPSKYGELQALTHMHSHSVLRFGRDSPHCPVRQSALQPFHNQPACRTESCLQGGDTGPAPPKPITPKAPPTHQKMKNKATVYTQPHLALPCFHPTAFNLLSPSLCLIHLSP